MFSRGTRGVNPHEPSTSTGPQRRRQDNLRKFNEISSKNQEKTLWHVCTAHQRDPRAKMRYRLEIQDLTAVDFKELLYDHRNELNAFSKASGTTYKDLLDALRSFARFKKVPYFEKTDALEFFKLVCNCIFHVENEWVDGLSRQNLLNPRSLRFVMKDVQLTDSMRSSMERESSELNVDMDGPTTSNHNLLEQPAPVSRLQDREKVPIPPPPTQYVPYEVAHDEYLRDMHHYNFLRCNDDTFVRTFEKALTRIMKYGEADCRKNAKNSIGKSFPGYEDYEYYQDNSKLRPSQLSFRLNTVAQILPFDLPKSKADGYFPKDCQNRPQYVFDRYEEANRMCKNDFGKIRQPYPIKEGFKQGALTQKECYEFHQEGRHIHGFFDVWEEEARGWKNPVDGQWVSRRYLVDIYNQLMFPLHSKRLRWPQSLRWAYDKYSCYALKLWHMTRECSTQLINAGDALFQSYSQNVLAVNKIDFVTERGRAIFFQNIQAENAWVADQFLNGIQEPKKEEEGEQKPPEEVVKPRRKRKGDPKLEEAEAMAASPAKQQRTPKKIPETAFSSGPIVPMMHIQKENLERPQVATVIPATPPQSSPYRYHQTPPSAVKRRITESESDTKPVAIQPPHQKRKLSISLENWNDRCVQGSIQEEHVDGREDDGYVWVPQDRGDRVEPEDYAREILAHYQGGREDRAASPPPAAKTARRRKTAPKNVPISPDRAVAAQPVLYAKPTTSAVSTSSAVSSLSVSAPNPAENLAVPPGKTTTTAGKKRLQYSCKPNQPPSRFHLSNKYPVKQLPHGTPPSVNGTRYPNAAVATGTPSLGARISPYGGTPRTPYYPPQQMRRPQPPPVMHHRFANGMSPSPSSVPPQPPHRMPLHPQGPAMYRLTSVSPAVPQEQPRDAITPAKRAIANHQSSDTCRRVLPYDVVMDHKPNHPWKRKLAERGLLAPPAPPQPPPQPAPTAVTVPPKPPLVVRRPASSGTTQQRVEYRQRSFSNVRPPGPSPNNGASVPPIANPTVWPPQSPATSSASTVSVAKERNVGLNKSRQERPWVPNNRVQPTAAPPSAMATAVMVNSSRHPMVPPMGHPLQQLQHPTGITAMAQPTGPMVQQHQQRPPITTVAPPRPGMTIAARVVPTPGTPSRMIPPPQPANPAPAPTGEQQMSIKELSTAIRKNCKTLTPEQHGDALRTHSRRFQVESPRGSSAPPPPIQHAVNFLNDNRQ